MQNDSAIQMLLVEDNPGDAFLVCTLLQDSPTHFFDIAQAASLREAMVMLDGWPRGGPDLIMLDLTLPDSNGVNTITRLRGKAPDIPLIVLTGHKDEKLADEALRYGAEDYITKDFTSGAPMRRAVRYAIERRRVEKARQETERRYRQLVELAPELIATLINGRITFVNGPGARMLGAPHPSDIIGQGFVEFLSPESAEAVVEKLAPLLVEGAGIRSAMIEAMVHRQDGAAAEIELRAVPFEEAGQPALLLVGTDVTEANKVQRQLVQTSKMATLGEMAASVAHEVNQPLNIIRMAADACLMEYELGKPRADFQQEKLSVISEQTSRMAEIIDHMRIYSRRDEPGTERFDPFQAVKRSVEMMETEIRHAGIVLELVIPDIPVMITGHKVQLEQVIVNLISNARDAITETLVEDLQAGLIRVTAFTEPDEGIVCILINDNGGGVPEEAMDLIFDPFFTTKDVGHGTGLGLSVSLGIIQGMSGEMEVRNEGDGACFEVVLPLSMEEGSEQELDFANQELEEDLIMTEALLRGSDAPHILIADDELEAGKLVSDFLLGQGYQVSQVTNGADALALYHEDPADLLITDVRMPEMTGNELVQEIRKVAADLPVIIVTGHTGDVSCQELLKEGRDKILAKPLNLRALAHLVTQICSH